MNKLGFARRAMLGATAVIALTAAGTAFLGNSKFAYAADTGIKIGYAQNTLGEQFQATKSKIFLEQAQKLGLEVMAINANRKSDAQHNAIMQMVNAGVKGIVVTPVDSKAIIPAIKYANSRNVPVVTVDSTAAGGDIYIAIGASNRDMGAQACDAVGKQLGGAGEVLMLSGDLTDFAGLDRSQGFQDCIKAKFPGITVYEQAANWDSAKAGAGVQTVLTAHPDVKAIYMATDTLYLTPTWAALQRLGKARPVGEDGHIYMVSIDGSPAGLAGLREGRMDLVISQPLTEYGEFAVRYIEAAIKGEKQSVGNGMSGPIVEVNDQLTAVIPSNLVTKENVDDPSLWGNKAN